MPLTVDEFAQLCPSLVHFAPRGRLRLDEGLLSARQVVEANASPEGKVSARYVAETDWREVEVRSLVEGSRFLRGAGELGSNVLVRGLVDRSRVYFLGNNYPLGDGSCLGRTIRLTDNRAGDPEPTREDWFRILNSMFWFFDSKRISPGFLAHLSASEERGQLSRITLQVARVPRSLLMDRLRLSRINGGATNGAAPRGTATYKRLPEWSGRWPPREIGFWDGIPADECRALHDAGALVVEEWPDTPHAPKEEAR